MITFSQVGIWRSREIKELAGGGLLYQLEMVHNGRDPGSFYLVPCACLHSQGHLMYQVAVLGKGQAILILRTLLGSCTRHFCLYPHWLGLDYMIVLCF